jgi:hypothetical protein
MVVYSGLLQTAIDANIRGKRRQTVADGSRQRQTVAYNHKHGQTAADKVQLLKIQPNSPFIICHTFMFSVHWQVAWLFAGAYT